MGIPLEIQIAWSNADEAFEEWRTALERVGVWIFKDAFRNDFYSGFCLYDEVFPIIYINNSTKTRQLFTLFHELAHLLFHTSGIVTREGEPSEDLLPYGKRIEVLCNQFAAEFLLPAETSETEIAGRPPNEQTATEIAEKFHVSRAVVFRRFLDWGLISREDYELAAHRWDAQRNNEETGGNHYWTKIAYLGANYINLAFSRYHQNQITEP